MQTALSLDRHLPPVTHAGARAHTHAHTNAHPRQGKEQSLGSLSKRNPVVLLAKPEAPSQTCAPLAQPSASKTRRLSTGMASRLRSAAPGPGARRARPSNWTQLLSSRARPAGRQVRWDQGTGIADGGRAAHTPPAPGMFLKSRSGGLEFPSAPDFRRRGPGEGSLSKSRGPWRPTVGARRLPGQRGQCSRGRLRGRGSLGC